MRLRMMAARVVAWMAFVTCVPLLILLLILSAPLWIFTKLLRILDDEGRCSP